MPTQFKIAIDGPAASGKSSAASCLAQKLNFQRLDCGSIYRAITFIVLSEFTTLPSLDSSNVKGFIENIKICVKNQRIYFNNRDITDELRGEMIDRTVGKIAKVKYIRQKVHKIERDIIDNCKGGIVVDGRDIGTVVMPDADLKFFITASAKTRAKRRCLQNESHNYDEILNEINKRDYDDIHREIDPLRQAEDAIIIKNDDITFDETIDLLIKKYNEKIHQLNK